MGYLDNFGFKFYRLREARESDEFLFYNEKRQTYNQYSKKRLAQVLKKELEINNFDWKKFTEFLKEKYEQSTISVDQIIEDDYILLDNLGYKPTNELIFKDGKKEFFNVYEESQLLQKKNELEIKSFDNIKKLIMNLVSNNENEYNYIIKWLAWQIQNPLQRLPTSIILQGEHGTGKTKFCELVLKPIFENNFCEIGQADINKEYNDYILGKQIIVANEVIHNDNKFLVPDKLKNYVTDEFLSINRKFKDTIYVRNYAHWIFVTNNPVPLKIEKGDRRYSVFKSKKLNNGRELIGNLLLNHEIEIKSFLRYLLDLEVTFMEVSEPLHNEAKTDIIKMSQNSVEEFLDFAEEVGGLDKLNSMYQDNNYFTNSLQLEIKNDNIFVRTEQLFKLYVKFCEDYGINMKFSRTGFTRQLKFLGYENTVQRIDNESVRVITLKNEQDR